MFGKLLKKKKEKRFLPLGFEGKLAIPKSSSWGQKMPLFLSLLRFQKREKRKENKKGSLIMWKKKLLVFFFEEKITINFVLGLNNFYVVIFLKR